MSKGSLRRPTDAQAYGANFDVVFRKKEQEQVCSFPFCECPKGEWQELLQCNKGLPWKKEEK